MYIAKTKEALRTALDNLKEPGTTGFVPTMGALHAGHISLVERSKKENAVTVVSIFVNPTQFNNKEDFEKYPVTIEEDIRMLADAGCDVVFLPAVEEMYPPSERQRHYELGKIEELLEGKYRPGHYQGVATIVDKLLKAVQPDKMYMGLKDYQQVMVVRKMTAITGDKVEIVPVETMREKDGLAMSSRNRRLDAGQREGAVAISQELKNIQAKIKNMPVRELEQAAIKTLTDKGFKVDYVSIADAHSLELAEDSTPNKVALIAAFTGDIRLIDNLILS